MVNNEVSYIILKGYGNGLREKRLRNKKDNGQKRQKENQEVGAIF